MRFPLQGAVHLETSYISTNDRFAAQIVYAAGRCPPIFRLPSTDLFLSFQFFGLRLGYAVSVGDGGGIKSSGSSNAL